MKILVIDDEEDIVVELGSFLRRRGHEVTGAGSVGAALRALGIRGPFDVVLTDLRMPDGCGLDVLRACAALRAPQPATLVMSGHADASHFALARTLGAFDVFSKPVALRSLLQTLKDIEAARPREPVPHRAVSAAGAARSR
jgi:two-component system response regulator PilR (NtrC family)